MVAYKKSKTQKGAGKSKSKSSKNRPRRPKHSGKLIIPPAPLDRIPQWIIDDILTKKDLLAHPDLAKTLVARYLGKHLPLLEKFQDSKAVRSADYELMKKWVRQELRVLVGMFVIETDPSKLIEARTNVILSSHRSTKERAEHYSTLYSELFGEEKPNSILDLCAGINPCSYEYLGCKPKYTAVDVSPQLMDFVDAWFKFKEIDGTAFSADVTSMTEFPEGDTVFLFKATDVLERIKYGIAEQLMEQLIVREKRRVILSFATATIGGGREIKVTKRSWVERWTEKHGVNCRIHDVEGERFYILTV